MSEEMNKMKIKFETESRVLSDRFQFASNQVHCHLIPTLIVNPYIDHGLEQNF